MTTSPSCTSCSLFFLDAQTLADRRCSVNFSLNKYIFSGSRILLSFSFIASIVVGAWEIQRNDPQIIGFGLRPAASRRRMGQNTRDGSPQLCGPRPPSKLPGFTCLLSRSKHTFVKLFRDVSKVQFCFIVTVNPNHLMLISYNLLHCQLSSSSIFISQLNVHLFVDIFIKLDCNKSVRAYIYFPFVLKNSK